MPWSAKQSKMAQPDLDYTAPELLNPSLAYTSGSSDMFSLGLLVCAVYSGGRSLIQAGNNPAVYQRQVEQVTNYCY